MTVEEALELLVRLVAQVSMPLSGHIQAQQAGQTLAQFVADVQASAAVDKEQEEAEDV
jgi:hypothetical protein